MDIGAWVANLGAVGAVIVIVLWLIQKTLPAMMQAQREDLNAARAEFRESLDKQQEEQQRQRAEFLAALKDEQAEFRTSIREQHADFRVALKEQQASDAAKTERSEARWQAAAEAMVEKIDAVDRHTKNNTDHVINLQKTVIDRLTPYHPGARKGRGEATDPPTGG